eukprot:TRINITY_DN10251_c0_g2_i1.p1 TRINITY_DN10251_c0_g2~~TRINITY_DN10251_c0_g2_i1.p1  ORF type:complete len:865 (-),score=43.50 TRINITY_DN10251_c0_g2_i1:181-2775(-)
MCSILIILVISASATLGVGYKEVTIHINGYSSPLWKHDSSTWPCLEMSPHGQHIHVNHYGCSQHYIGKARSTILWIVPEGEGPIRLASKPELCIDARAAMSFLRRSGTCNNSFSLKSVLRRVVTVERCDGSESQQFHVEYGESAIVRAATNSSWALAFDVATLTLEHACQAHSPRFGFSVVVFPKADSLFFFGGYAGAYEVLQCVYLWKIVLLLWYVSLCVTRACKFRVQAALSRLQGVWAYVRKPTEVKVQILVSERRLRRAQHITSHALHVFLFWLVWHGFALPWKTEHSEEESMQAAWKLASNCMLPRVAMTTLCFLMQLRPIQHACILDALTIVVSFIFVAQYYMMGQFLGGTNVDTYLFHESWMMVARTLLNMTVGRAKITVPCTIIVTIADIHAFHLLSPLYRSRNYSLEMYRLKQLILCSMTCAMYYCVERLASLEAQSALEVQRAELHEQLATRLTRSMCEAVVHLDNDLKFSKPAVKLGRILFRHQLGGSPTAFLNIVHSDDHERFRSHLKYVEDSDTMEPLMPLHFSLLDTSGACCRVQMFASAYRDQEQAVHYVLGFVEIQDVHVTTERNPARAPDIFGTLLHESIPEDSAIESDSDVSQSSILSNDVSQPNHVSCDVIIHQTSEIIMSCDAALSTLMQSHLVGTSFPSLFRDPSAVTAWVHMKAASVQSGAPLTLQERTSGIFVSQRGKSRYDTRIIVGETSSIHVGIPTTSLAIHLEKRHKRKGKRSSRVSRMLGASSEDMAVACDVAVRASAKDLELALEAIQSSSQRVFEPFFNESFVHFQMWWNECLESLDTIPFRSSRGKLLMDIHRGTSREYIVSVHLHIPDSLSDIFRLTPSRVPEVKEALKLCL